LDATYETSDASVADNAVAYAEFVAALFAVVLDLMQFGRS